MVVYTCDIFSNTYETLLYNFEMHWSLSGVSHLVQMKLVNCNQILSNVDENWISKFHVKREISEE